MSFVVGLTGGIGSGKSAAAAEFGRLGAGVVDTDEISRELTAPDGAAMPHIAKLFGPQYIAPHGGLDRERMRAHAFSDAGLRKRLEDLLHPMIRAESERRVRAVQGPYALLVVPLLVEAGSYRSRVDRVLVVDCPEALQVARVRSRSGLPESEVRAIVAAQATRDERLAAADDVIDNSGTREALQEQVARLHDKYLALSARTE